MKFSTESYKDFNAFQMTWYQARERNGKLVDVNGLVNPLKIDNRQCASVTDNQGQTPQCAAYSICNLFEAIIWKKTGKLINLNAEQVYRKAKELDGDPNTDGTYLEHAISAALMLSGLKNYEKYGPGFLYNDRTTETINLVKFLIHKYDFIQAGFKIQDGWYRCNNSNFIINCNGRDLGGHAVLLVGYDEYGVYIQNSWGKQWGSFGFGIMSWNDFLNQFIYCCFIDEK